MRVKWHHAESGEPVDIYSEIGADGYEVRKVNLFPDGHLECADADQETVRTALGVEPVPPIAEINADAVQITAGEFEAIWRDAHIRVTGLAAAVWNPGGVIREKDEQIDAGAMPMSLGPVADLFWMLAPETRPAIYRRVQRDFEDAIEYDRFLQWPLDGMLAIDIYNEVIKPAFEARQEDVLERCFRALRRILRTDGHHVGVIIVQILERIKHDGFVPLVRELDAVFYQFARDQAELWRD
jgi:hypothetical protein